jgi:glucose-1-phosphate thymidylyltransferase
MNRKGIILAGGKGTRLYPTTKALPKCLLPIYDKPMIYYSVSTLMLAGIREILVITTPIDKERVKTLLGDGKQWGINIVYRIQDQPNGIADALIIAQEFLNNHPCALTLGDNIFYGSELQSKLTRACLSKNNTIFTYEVSDPERFGICELNNEGKVLSIEEKPSNPKSNLCVTGIYFYDEHAYEIASSILPSPRGELEITDVNLVYVKQENLFAEVLDQKYTWMDAGTVESFLEASLFVRSIQQESNIKISCPEEIAFNNKWINEDGVKMIAEDLSSSPYSDYLLKKIKK